MDDDIDTIAFYDDEEEMCENGCNNEGYTDDNDFEYDYDLYSDGGSETIPRLIHYCLKPTLYDAASYMVPLLVASLAFKIFAQSQFTPCRIFHGISAITGLYVVQHYVPECLHLIIILIAATYISLYIPEKYYKGIKAFLPSILVIFYCELWMKPAEWHKVRSVIMVAAMKAVSVAMDNIYIEKRPNLWEYSGYMLCASTCLFGPWISFKDYVALYHRNHWTAWWALATIGNLLISFVFLSISNCWTQWMLSANAGKWLVAYRDALAFRASHYFISYTASGILLLGGHPVSLTTITKPFQIELPHSLVQVVVCWNIPMHFWLKTYIFRPSVMHLGKFGAVIVTYLTSSLLHGLNFQLAAVLLSLGFYTYVEFQLRSILANTFDACIASKRCSDRKCSHARTVSNCWKPVTAMPTLWTSGRNWDLLAIG
ncbi:protein-serine O-palmitoleoyltransferase porcupine isoform X2 [Cephus cinctus]|uniref:Protein-serine O-palmitoleoyltransferase porcupine n=1 Tax=Cephus cinctus TaxID=211228 RepID=A0AAJ7RHA2_CEPCN|nr:protein-serine O-palmitoleoyltransferase porcupine isoform X2 [Cephus cinctus]